MNHLNQVEYNSLPDRDPAIHSSSSPRERANTTGSHLVRNTQRLHETMDPVNVALYIVLALLMIDSIIELAFISSMVAWLHNRAGGSFNVIHDGDVFSLHGKPANLLVDQGHTSNGAAGTAFVLIGLGGVLALWLRGRSNFRTSVVSKLWYHFWLVMTIPSTILTLVALIYTFVVTNDHKGQVIDIGVASTLDNQPYPNYVAYPLDEWTPENWFDSVLQLPLADGAESNNIRLHLNIMEAWRWNLIPMFLIGVAVTTLAIMDALERRKRIGAARDYNTSQESKRVSV